MSSIPTEWRVTYIFLDRIEIQHGNILSADCIMDEWLRSYIPVCTSTSSAKKKKNGDRRMCWPFSILFFISVYAKNFLRNIIFPDKIRHVFFCSDSKFFNYISHFICRLHQIHLQNRWTSIGFLHTASLTNCAWGSNIPEYRSYDKGIVGRISLINILPFLS